MNNAEKYVRTLVNAHNAMIDHYINVELAEQLGAKDGKIKMDQWFLAQRLIREQNFYAKGKAVLDVCRAAGFDVKMDMQSDKLVF